MGHGTGQRVSGSARLTSGEHDCPALRDRKWNSKRLEPRFADPNRTQASMTRTETLRQPRVLVDLSLLRGLDMGLLHDSIQSRTSQAAFPTRTVQKLDRDSSAVGRTAFLVGDPATCRRSLKPCGVKRNSLSENNLRAGRVFGHYDIAV